MLGIVPENAIVIIFNSDKTDDYGIKVPDTEGTAYGCRQSINTKMEQVLLPNSSVYVYSVAFLFNGEVPVKAGDIVEFTDGYGEKQKKQIKAVQFKRDFSNAVLITKAVI